MGDPISYETLIVAYELGERASAAIAALRGIGVPPGDIKRHPVSKEAVEEVAVGAEPTTGQGFFSWLFGHDTVAARVELYRKALEAGGTVISVRVTSDKVTAVYRLLQEFGPLDWEITPSGDS